MSKLKAVFLVFVCCSIVLVFLWHILRQNAYENMLAKYTIENVDVVSIFDEQGKLLLAVDSVDHALFFKEFKYGSSYSPQQPLHDSKNILTIVMKDGAFFEANIRTLKDSDYLYIYHFKAKGLGETSFKNNKSKKLYSYLKSHHIL